MKTLAVLFLCLPCIPWAASLSAEARPNVVYILADDLGYGDLSCYGQKKFKTPNIDRLAGEGLRFTDHYSGNTVCSPSRASLMTGQHPGHCYLRGNAGPTVSMLDPAMTVLPEVFRAAGYATGAFGKWGMGVTCNGAPADPLGHGFDEFYGWKSQTIAHTYYPSSVVHNGKEVPLEEGTYVHPLVMGKAREFISRSVKAGKPFFCYIPTAIPHAAMHAPSELHEKWRKKFPQFDDKIGKYGAGPGEVCPPVRNPIAGFAAMMEHLDNEVGELLDLLEELGIDDDTLVMFSSDNGAHKEGGHDPTFWNSTGSLRGHKRDMHEGGIRAPMLARWPAVIEAGRTTGHASAFWDVLPTMAELVGQPVPEQNDGISFVATLQGKPAKQKAHDYLYWEFTKGKGQKIFSRAVRKGKWKVYREEGRKLELFNLEEDPFEKNDVAAGNPEIVSEFEKIIEKAHRDLPE